MMGSVVRSRLRDTWRKPPAGACVLSSLTQPMRWKLLDPRKPQRVWQVGGEALVPSGVRQLAGFACVAARPHWRGRLRASFSCRGPCCRGGPSSSPRSWMLRSLELMLVLVLPGRTHAENALASHSGSLKGRSGSFRGTKQRCVCLSSSPCLLSLQDRDQRLGSRVKGVIFL